MVIVSYWKTSDRFITGTFTLVDLLILTSVIERIIPKLHKIF